MADDLHISKEITTQYERQNEALAKQLSIQKSIMDVVSMREKSEEQFYALSKNLQAEARRHYDQIASRLDEIKQKNYNILSVERQMASATSAADVRRFEALLTRFKLEKQAALDAIANEESALQALVLQNQTAKTRLSLTAQLRGELGKVLSKQTGLSKNLAEYGTHIEQTIPKLKGWGTALAAAWMAIVYIARQAFEIFKQLDKSAWEFRKALGGTRDSTKIIYDYAKGIATEFADVGVSFDLVHGASLALGHELGGIFNISKEVVANTAIIEAQLGVAAADTADFLRNMAAVSKTTAEGQQKMAYFAASLSQAAGVPLPEVMKDVGKLSGAGLTMVSRMPLQLVKAAVEARKLGVTLKEMANASRDILNFTENINAEMEASVLVGKSINLQRARELAYQRDIVGSTNEILKQAKAIDFENLDTFQMDAFARASGRSVDELMKMLQAQRQLDKARASGDPAIQKQLRAYEEMKSANEAIAKQQADSLEHQLKTQANQERITAITQKWNKFMMQLSEAFLPIIDAALSIAPPIMEAVFWTMKLAPAVYTISKLLGNVAFYTNVVAKMFGRASVFGAKFVNILLHVSTWGKTMGGVFGFLLRGFSRFLGPIGWIINGLIMIPKFWKNLVKMFTGDFWGGLKGLGDNLGELLLGPLWGWIKKLFAPGSLSTFGQMIFDGVKMVGSMWLKTWMAPFKAIGGIFKKIFGKDVAKEAAAPEVTTKIHKSVEHNVRAGVINAAAVAPVPITPVDTTKSKASVQVGDTVGASISETIIASNQKLIELLQGLRSDLAGGKVGVYIDGQLLSATLARQTAFKGGYGTNQVTVG